MTTQGLETFLAEVLRPEDVAPAVKQVAVFLRMLSADLVPTAEDLKYLQEHPEDEALHPYNEALTLSDLAHLLDPQERDKRDQL